LSRPDLPPSIAWEELITRALAEDLGRAGDLTSLSVIPEEARAAGHVVARRAGVVAGLPIALSAFGRLDRRVVAEPRVDDGDRVEPGTVLAALAGPARALLAGERTCLNLLGHLSGVASATRELVDAVTGTRATIVDTRKTTPGLRVLEKYAVRCGGGRNHRFGLDDAILIKDNHVVVAGGAGEAVRRAREKVGHLVKVEVEITRLDQLEAVITAGADVVMLDNFELDAMRAAVAAARGRVPLEASGGVTAATVAAIAATGVDLISAGWITHSAPALDVALDFET
jgi:nicotinate-nucleotide pyrophosphorylase (carboxylating)